LKSVRLNTSLNKRKIEVVRGVIWHSCVHSYGRNFFKGHFQILCTFPTIFSKLRFVWHWFFYWRIALSIESVCHTFNMFPKWFPPFYRHLKTFEKMFKTSLVCNFPAIFWKLRVITMTLIYLLTYSPESGECLSYFQYFSKVISHHSMVIWSRNFRKKCSKLHFCGWQKIEYGSLLSDIFNITFVAEI